MKVIKHLTPLLLAALALSAVFFYYLLGSNAAEVKSSVALITLPVAGGCLAADWVIKKMLRKKLIWIWIAELLLLLAIVYLWIIAE